MNDLTIYPPLVPDDDVYVPIWDIDLRADAVLRLGLGGQKLEDVVSEAQVYVRSRFFHNRAQFIRTANDYALRCWGDRRHTRTGVIRMA